MASLTRHAKWCMGTALSYVAFWISWTLSQALHCIVWQPISTGIWSGGLNFLMSSMVSVTFFTNAQLSLFKLMLILLIWGLFFWRGLVLLEHLSWWIFDFHINYKEAICVTLSVACWCHTWGNWPFLYIVIMQLLLPCWIKAQTKAPQWCISRGGSFGSLLHIIFVLKLSMLQGSLMFWLTIFHVCMNLSICRGFFSCLLGSGSNAAIISVVSHMSVATYFWLLGTYFLPLI